MSEVVEKFCFEFKLNDLFTCIVCLNFFSSEHVCVKEATVFTFLVLWFILNRIYDPRKD